MPSSNQSDTTPKTCKEYQELALKFICLTEDLWTADKSYVSSDHVEDLREAVKNYTGKISPSIDKILNSK